jgi:hypothetical protein
MSLVSWTWELAPSPKSATSSNHHSPMLDPQDPKMAVSMYTFEGDANETEVAA